MASIDLSKLTGRTDTGAADTSNKDLQDFHKIVCDEWQILKKHYHNTDWQGITADLDRYVRGYEGNPFLKAMAINMAIVVHGFLGVEYDYKKYLKDKAAQS